MLLPLLPLSHPYVSKFSISKQIFVAGKDYLQRGSVVNIALQDMHVRDACLLQLCFQRSFGSRKSNNCICVILRKILKESILSSVISLSPFEKVDIERG